jgi:hypothetical protein
MHEIGEYKVECLSEHEAEFKKALARESGVQGGLLDEKKIEGRKSRDTVPVYAFEN